MQYIMCASTKCKCKCAVHAGYAVYHWCAFLADEWGKGLPHLQQDTTPACEGFYLAITSDELATKTRLQGRRGLAAKASVE